MQSASVETFWQNIDGKSIGSEWQLLSVEKLFSILHSCKMSEIN